MKIRVKLGLAAALGLGLAAGLALNAGAQDPVGDIPAGLPPLTDWWNANKGGFQNVVQRPTGQWAEVVNATSKWIVIQDQDGRQFPIAADRVRQFLVRWPSTTASLTPASMIEVTGPDAGSNTIIAEHIDQYEAGAQSLISPGVNYSFNNLGFNFFDYGYGYNQTPAPWEADPMRTFQSTYSFPAGLSGPYPLHVVGRALSSDPVQVTGLGNNWFTVQPAATGMTVTQVTVGNNSYAKPGDVVFVIADNLSSRSLDVSQLVLYKKIPLARFQP
jgi:hypothetical protein